MMQMPPKNKKILEKADGSASDSALFKEDMPGPIRINTAEVWMNKKIDPKKQKGLGLETSAEEDTLMGRLAKRMASRDYIDNLDLGTRTAQKAREISEDSKVVKEISDDSIPRGLRIGSQIEREHDGTFDKLNPKYDKKAAAKLIAKDHLKEHKLYYDKKVGLPEMEKKLTKIEKADNSIQAPNGMGLFKHMEDKKAVNFSDPIPQRMVLAGNNMAQQARKAGKVVGSKGNIVGKPYSE